MDLLEDVIVPSLDETVERLSAEVHALYQAEIRRQGREERHNDDYYALPEHVKELDRVFVRWHLAQLRGHARPSLNGRVHGAYTHVCASCGTEFTSNRRAVPGKKSWCGRPDCKKVAAAERAREYRQRRT